MAHHSLFKNIQYFTVLDFLEDINHDHCMISMGLSNRKDCPNLPEHCSNRDCTQFKWDTVIAKKYKETLRSDNFKRKISETMSSGQEGVNIEEQLESINDILISAARLSSGQKKPLKMNKTNSGSTPPPNG
jgi:hypothetical protein